MADTNTIQGNLIVQGYLSVGQGFSIPDGAITNDNIVTDAGIEASKLNHQHMIAIELFGPAVSVAALTRQLFIAYAPGTILSAKASVVTVATGADRTVTVDVKRSTAAGAYATILTSTIGFTDASVVLTPVAAVINASLDDYIASDLFEVVVTVAGSAGAQAVGLLFTLITREEAQ